VSVPQEAADDSAENRELCAEDKKKKQLQNAKVERFVSPILLHC
jgi:hypothetical protein